MKNETLTNLIDLDSHRQLSFEFNQELEHLEAELSQVRTFLELSPRQRARFLESQASSPRKVVLQMISGLSAVYHRLPY